MSTLEFIEDSGQLTLLDKLIPSHLNRLEKLSNGLGSGIIQFHFNFISLAKFAFDVLNTSHAFKLSINHNSHSR